MTKKPNNHVVFVGGGSAGHVLPALPVADLLIARGAKVTFIGTRSGLEEGYVQGRDVEFIGISAGKLRRYFDWQNISDLGRIVLALFQALGIFMRLRPAVLVSKGGFVSVPPVVAARLLGIPVLAHESDLTPGLANRLSLPFIRTLCTSFADTKVSGFRGRLVCTGTPIRTALLQGQAQVGAERFGLPNKKPVLLVTGGSLGAKSLNTRIRAALPQLTERFYVVHVCGVGKMAPLASPDYQQLEFVDEGWGDLLAAADLVVSRAGANALFELIALKKLNLLIPLPAAASRGDQIENAGYAQRRGFSVVLDEAQATPEALVAALDTLLAETSQYRQALNAEAVGDAGAALLAELLDLAGDRLALAEREIEPS